MENETLEIIIKPENEESFNVCNQKLKDNSYSSSIPFNENSIKISTAINYKKVYLDKDTGIVLNCNIYIFNPNYHKKFMNYGADILLITVENQESINNKNNNLFQIKDKNDFFESFSNIVKNYVTLNTEYVKKDFRFSAINEETIINILKDFQDNNVTKYSINSKKNSDGTYYAIFHFEGNLFNPEENEIIIGLDYFNGMNT
jgi:hypothetical protein